MRVQSSSPFRMRAMGKALDSRKSSNDQCKNGSGNLCWSARASVDFPALDAPLIRMILPGSRQSFINGSAASEHVRPPEGFTGILRPAVRSTAKLDRALSTGREEPASSRSVAGDDLGRLAGEPRDV